MQPRIGVIYNAGNAGKYKLTAHFGRYYATYPLYTVLDKIIPYNNLGVAYLADPRIPGLIVEAFIFGKPLSAIKPPNMMKTARMIRTNKTTGVRSIRLMFISHSFLKTFERLNCIFNLLRGARSCGE